MKRRSLILGAGASIIVPRLPQAQTLLRGLSSGPTNNRSFSTTFSDAPETPISESGAWFHTPNPWAFVDTVSSPNRAIGTQSGSGAFDDSYAYLSGFGPDVTCMATVNIDPTYSPTNGESELEIRLRVSDNSTQSFGYECNFSVGGFYAQIVRWNGNLSDFTFINQGTSYTAPATGDIVRADITGSNIATYIMYASTGGSTWVPLATGSDSTFATGQPGIGMWLQGSPTNNSRYGFTAFTATQTP
jgi:hypothetical protein